MSSSNAVPERTHLFLKYKAKCVNREERKDVWGLWKYMGFLHSSLGKESTCNTGDPSSIRGSGRSAGEGIGYPLQYSWASLVAQLVKNLPAMWETWIRSLGWEDPLEKGRATHSSILAWRIQSMGLQRVRHDWVLSPVQIAGPRTVSKINSVFFKPLNFTAVDQNSKS